MTGLEGSVSDTAYLVCESRARRLDISRDPFARKWIAPEQRESVEELWEDFSREVYPHDALEVSLRNRYWLERIEGFVEGADDPVFVNVGAGLTSYPFLLADPIPAVELDRPPVVAYKEARARELKRQGALPERNVAFHGVDLGSAGGLERLESLLGDTCGARSSFVLCEGLLYYLERSTVDALVEIVRRAQEEGSVLGLDFWPPAVADSPVFHRMEAFFEERFGIERGGYTFLDERWVESIEGYEIQGVSNVVRQERVIAGTPHLQNSAAVLLEMYAALKRR